MWAMCDFCLQESGQRIFTFLWMSMSGLMLGLRSVMSVSVSFAVYVIIVYLADCRPPDHSMTWDPQLS